MATHSSILAWRSPWTEEPGGLQSIGLQRVRDDCRDIAHTCSYGQGCKYKCPRQRWFPNKRQKHYFKTYVRIPKCLLGQRTPSPPDKVRVDSERGYSGAV